MARSIFKATIAIGNDEIPVKLYSAVEDRSVHFRLLHRPDRVPVKQRMVNAQSGEPVERGDIRKGYPIGKDTFVLLTEEEINAIEPESSREITVSKFRESRDDPSAMVRATLFPRTRRRQCALCRARHGACRAQ